MNESVNQLINASSFCVGLNGQKLLDELENNMRVPYIYCCCLVVVVVLYQTLFPNLCWRSRKDQLRSLLLHSDKRLRDSIWCKERLEHTTLHLHYCYHNIHIFLWHNVLKYWSFLCVWVEGWWWGGGGGVGGGGLLNSRCCLSKTYRFYTHRNVL